MAGRILVHGHRGARAARPENTLAAFEYGIRAGADYLELDVLATRDDVPVVCHDPVRNPALCLSPGGSDVVRELSAAELAHWDCGSLRHHRFPHQETAPGARVPTLSQVLELSRGAAVGFNIEVKSFPEHPDYAPSPARLAELVVGEVRRHALADRVIVQSFDFRVLHAVRALAPELRIAALWERGGDDFAAIAAAAGARIVAPQHTLVTPEKVHAAHAAGLQVVPWTANTAGNWTRLVRAGVDGIITDDPSALVAFLKGDRRI